MRQKLADRCDDEAFILPPSVPEQKGGGGADSKLGVRPSLLLEISSPLFLSPRGAHSSEHLRGSAGLTLLRYPVHGPAVAEAPD